MAKGWYPVSALSLFLIKKIMTLSKMISLRMYKARLLVLVTVLYCGSQSSAQSSEYTIESFQSVYEELTSYQSIGILTGGDPLWEYEFEFGFTFPFYDSSYQSIFYEQNAWGAFTDDEDEAVYLMNSNSSYTYDNILDTSNITSDVRFATVIEGSMQAFVIQFTKARFFADPFEDSLDTYFNFQIWFFENGVMEMHFGEFHMDGNPIYEEGKGFFHYTTDGGVDTTEIDGPHVAISHPLDPENAIGLAGAYNDYEVVGDIYAVMTVLPPEGWIIRFKPMSVGLFDITKAFESLEICPNPTTTYIRLPEKEGKIQVFDASGKLMYSADSNESRLDISMFPSGLYYVQIVGEDKVAVGKFMKS